MLNIIQKEIPKGKRVYLENKSMSTIGNVIECSKIMKKNNFKTAIIIAQQLHARRVKETFKILEKNNFKIYIIKAQSNYGGGSQRRLNNFINLLLWDTISSILFKLRILKPISK